MEQINYRLTGNTCKEGAVPHDLGYNLSELILKCTLK